MNPFSRRKFVLGGGAAVLGGGLLGPTPRTASGQTASPSAPAAAAPATLTPLQRFPRSVHEYFVEQARAIERESNARREALRTRADAERYVAEVREKVRLCFGPFPEKTPLNPRVTAVHARDAYRIENVIFDSRPNFPVTANLYVPTGRNGRLPGVIGTCGHSKLMGKGAPPYQSFAQGLARQGYVVLIFDPMGQGERLQHLYRLLGAEKNFSSFLGVEPHGFSQANREAMYGWFNRQTGIAQGQKEPALSLEKDEVLQCVKGKAQVAALQPATAFSFVQEKSRRLAAGRPSLQGAALKEAVVEVLKVPSRMGVPDYRIMRSSGDRSYPAKRAAHYVVETEPGIQSVVVRLSETSLLSRVPRGPTRAMLYVAHRSADAELRSDAWLREWVQQQDKTTALFFCDLRGIGESKPALSAPEFSGKGGIDYFHAGLSLMLDRPMAGQRTFDLLRVLDWLQSSGHREIHLVSQGDGTIPSTFASLLHDRVTRVILRHALRNYREVAETEAYRWPLSALVPRVLTRFDLDDCYRELAGKSLQLIDPVGAEGVPGRKV